MKRFTHTAFQVNMYEPYIELAERLNALAPFKDPAKAVPGHHWRGSRRECGKDRARRDRSPGRHRVQPCISRSDAAGFYAHGQDPALQAARAGAPAPEIYRLPFPAAHSGVTVQDLQDALNELFLSDVEPTRVAAMIIEPVQGEGGFNPVPPEVFEAVTPVL